MRPFPPRLRRVLSGFVVVGWTATMAVLIHRSYIRPAAALAADLDRYRSGGQWKGIYYKGEKIGFMVGQTVSLSDGYELREDGQIQMFLLGATTAARVRTTARVDREFTLRSFSFSLDPGTGPITVEGRLEGKLLHLDIGSPSGKRSETRELAEVPDLSLNLPRRLVARGLHPGQRITVSAFDPATLRNAPMTLEVQGREVVWVAGRPVPTHRITTEFAGLSTSSWITDVGEVVKEESPLGLVVVRENQETAMSLAAPSDVSLDLLEAAAVTPSPSRRIDNNTTVEVLRLRLSGASFDDSDLQGAGQTVDGNVFEIRDTAPIGPADPAARDFAKPEPLIESDAPEIVAEAARAVREATDRRTQAERLVRHVHDLLKKKPTVSIPSALEVLRTKVGDCNEHTTLYVALARSLGIPARIATGLVHMRGSFYYHAWAEIYLEPAPRRGQWLAVDPTLNQFPADAAHIRLCRGGLERQASLAQAIGRLKMTILDLKFRPNTNPVLVGRATPNARPIDIAIPRRDGSGRGCWSRTQ